MSIYRFTALLMTFCTWVVVFDFVSVCMGHTVDNCSAAAIGALALPHAVIHSVSASAVRNFSVSVPQNGAGPYFETTFFGLNFCNITITYSHTNAESDFSIRTTVWLPLDDWNGRFQGTGGSGFATGLGALGLAPAVANGFAAADTDGGHSEADGGDPTTWALNRSGRVDLGRLTAFASTSLNELAILGKAVTKTFYGVFPRYSYWNGCSTGGRQGLMLAQRYPHAFDGIIAASPAANWPSLTVSTYWPQQVMNRLEHFPHECELSYITQRAIEACDADDGVKDGIISLPAICKFDAEETIGQVIECAGDRRRISAATATVANAAWNGNGLWYGLNRGTYLAGMANTTCEGSSDSSCVGEPFEIAPWIPYFVEQNPRFNLANMTEATYHAVYHQSVVQYQDIIGTANPDLSSFKAAGGKMISTHGLADPAVFPNGTVQYYESVLFFDQDAKDYYRFFEAPGIGHCDSSYTKSFYPNDTMEALMRWVEQDQAPDTLTAVNQTDHTSTRPLCLYPAVQRYVGGEPDKSHSFGCF